MNGSFLALYIAPDDIKQACVRLTAYLYRQRDSQVFDVTAIPDAGVITSVAVIVVKFFLITFIAVIHVPD